MDTSCPELFGSSTSGVLSSLQAKKEERNERSGEERFPKVYKGAEAFVYIFEDFVVKERRRKAYRLKTFDEAIRKRRTRLEAKMLKRAEKEGIAAPHIIKTSEFCIKMTRILGKHIKPNKVWAERAAHLLKKLHSASIIHDDFTPANLIATEENKGSGKALPSLFIIDFGLAFVSQRIEDKASDLFTAAQSFKPYEGVFVRAYNDEVVEERYKAIRKRMRYVKD